MSPQEVPTGSQINESDDPLEGDPELRQELAAMFLEDCPRLLSEIHAAMLAEDGPALKLAAHTLKGSAGVFRVQAAFDAALRMEHIGKDCDWGRADEAWSDVNKEMARLSATLTGLIAAPSAVHVDPPGNLPQA